MRAALTAAGLALSVSGCIGDYILTCEMGTTPSFSGFGLSQCRTNFSSVFRDRQEGRWWIRLGDSQLGRVLDLYLPLDSGCDEVTFTEEGDTSDRCNAWASSADNNLGSYGPYHSDSSSGTANLTVDGHLPTRSSDGEATVEVDFGPGVKLTGSDGNVTIGGRLSAGTDATPVGPPGGAGGSCCGDEIDAMLPACDGDDKVFSFDCYCTAAQANHCVATSGCVSDTDAIESEATRLKEAAEATGDGTCGL